MTANGIGMNWRHWTVNELMVVVHICTWLHISPPKFFFRWFLNHTWKAPDSEAPSVHFPVHGIRSKLHVNQDFPHLFFFVFLRRLSDALRKNMLFSQENFAIYIWYTFTSWPIISNCKELLSFQNRKRCFAMCATTFKLKMELTSTCISLMLSSSEAAWSFSLMAAMWRGVTP